MKTVLLALFALLIYSPVSHSLCVKSKKANLRNGPSINHRITWQAFQYMPLKALGKKGKWYKVKDHDGYKHWIHQNMVTNDFKCAVVTKSRASAFMGPGKEYKRFKNAPYVYEDFSFRVLKGNKSWANVKSEWGERFWVPRSGLWIN